MILAGRELIDHLVPTPLLFSFFECSTFLQYCFYDRVLFLKAHGQCLHYCLMIFSFIIFFHFISFHFISFHFISFHFISFRFVSFRFVSFRFVSFRFVSLFFSLGDFVYMYNFLYFSGGFWAAQAELPYNDSGRPFCTLSLHICSSVWQFQKTGLAAWEGSGGDFLLPCSRSGKHIHFTHMTHSQGFQQSKEECLPFCVWVTLSSHVCIENRTHWQY